MTTRITGDTVETGDTETTSLSGALTDGQLVQGLLDGDLALNSNGEVVIQGGGTIAHTDADETITGQWDFKTNADFHDNINMRGDAQINAGENNITAVADPDPFGPMNAVNKRWAETQLPYLPLIEEQSGGSHYSAEDKQITGVADPDPFGPQNAANVRYVDNQTGSGVQSVSGMSVKDDNGNATRML